MLYILFLLVMNAETGMATVAKVGEAPSATACLLMVDHLNIKYEVEGLPVLAFCQSVRPV